MTVEKGPPGDGPVPALAATSRGASLGPTLPRAYRVLDVIVENYRTCTLRLDGVMQSDPGQFAMVWLPGLDEKPLSVQRDDPLSITVAAVGPFSRALQQVPPGGTVWCRGPYGNGFVPLGDDHLLVAGGYGAAPLLFLARRLAAAGMRSRVVVGAATREDLLLTEAFEAVGAEVHMTTEDGSAGTTGLVTEVVAPMLRDDPPTGTYACGPHGMLHALRGLATARGLPIQMSWEAYMRCGVGICGSCEHEGMLLCADGPVLDEAGQPPARGRS
ncbi:MAG: dihydroorotate dehydrogenase electron transfer subunit [Anaerolineae bacterium]